jgi:nucleolin
MGNKKP